MRRLATSLLLLAACPAPPLDTDPATGSGTEAGTDQDTDTDSAAAAVDLDQDGHSAATDCDDREPAVHPGAPERWDGLDNDCDGRIDGRGRFEGTHALRADAIVEGQARAVELVCAAWLERAAVIVDFQVRCEVPAEPPLGRQLLGETLTVSPEENVAEAGAWSGRTRVVSSNGWTAEGSGSALWRDDLAGIALSTRLDASSLALRGSGALVHAPQVPAGENRRGEGVR